MKGKLTCEKHPEITLNCFCPKCGGEVGGSANTPAQRAARKLSGASTGLLRKYPPCKISKYHRWTENQGKSCKCGIVRADYS